MYDDKFVHYEAYVLIFKALCLKKYCVSLRPKADVQNKYNV